MIESSYQMKEEKSILRWGGLAGMLGGIVFIFVPVTLFGFVPAAPVDSTALVMRFPSVRAAIAVGNGLDFVTNVLWVALTLALYLALRRTSPAPALIGSVLFILSLGVLFVESGTQVAFDPISSLYHTPGATSIQATTFGLVWQATQGMFNQFDTSATLLLSTGLIFLGVGMSKARAFGKGLGAPSVLLGVTSIIVISSFGVTSSLTAVLLLPIYVVLPILFGWKVYNLSRAS